MHTKDSGVNFLKQKTFICLEYSLGVMSAAIFKDGFMLGKIKKNNAALGNYSLVDLVRRLLDKTKLAKKLIDLVITTNGPGSFTAIRVLLSSSYGLSQGLNCQLFSVGALPIIAFSASSRKDNQITVITKAYQNQLYMGEFCFKQNKLLTKFKPVVCKVDDALILLKNHAVIYDPDNILAQVRKSKKFNVIKKKSSLNLAEKLGQLCLEYDFLAIAKTEIKPNYLKIPQAEEKFLKTHIIKT